MKKLAIVLGALGALAAGAAQADTTVVVHRDRPMMHHRHHDMCRTKTVITHAHGMTKRVTRRVCG